MQPVLLDYAVIVTHTHSILVNIRQPGERIFQTQHNSEKLALSLLIRIDKSDMSTIRMLVSDERKTHLQLCLNYGRVFIRSNRRHKLLEPTCKLLSVWAYSHQTHVGVIW